MANKREIDWLDCFGFTRQYTLLMVQSKHEPMRFSAKLANLYHCQFTFLADYAPDLTRPDIKFATYFAVLDAARDVQMVVMANHTEVPAATDDSKQSTLFSLPMFNDNFYFFNGKGKDKRLFGSPLNNYDYLIFLYSDKDYNTSEIVEKLQNTPTFMAEDVTYLLGSEVQKNEAKRRISVLKNLIEYMGVHMIDFQEERMKSRLNNKKIPIQNHVGRRSDNVDVKQTITSPLLNREDI